MQGHHGGRGGDYWHLPVVTEKRMYASQNIPYLTVAHLLCST